MTQRIAIMGAGAIGGYAGALLTRAGHDVTLIDAWPEHVQLIRTRGLRIRGTTPEETCEIRVNAIHISDVQSAFSKRPIDIAFLAVKSYDTAWATTMLRDYLAPGGFVVSMQNCINEEEIAAVVGWGRTMGCVVAYLAAELVEAGLVQRNVPIKPDSKVFILGEPHSRITDRATQVADLLRAVDSAEVTSNLWGERWSKLVINSMRNGLCAATGLSGNQRDLNDGPLSVSIRLGSQAVRVGQALGYQIEPMMGLHADTLGAAGEGDQAAKQRITDVLQAAARVRSDDQRPSMAQDIFKGRRTETDYINGFIAAKGRAIGVDASLHQSIHELVRRVERGELQARAENIAGL